MKRYEGNNDVRSKLKFGRTSGRIRPLSRITMCGMIEFQGDLFLLEIKLQKGKKEKE